MSDYSSSRLAFASLAPLDTQNRATDSSHSACLPAFKLVVSLYLFFELLRTCLIVCLCALYRNEYVEPVTGKKPLARFFYCIYAVPRHLMRNRVLRHRHLTGIIRRLNRGNVRLDREQLQGAHPPVTMTDQHAQVQAIPQPSASQLYIAPTNGHARPPGSASIEEAKYVLEVPLAGPGN